MKPRLRENLCNGKHQFCNKRRQENVKFALDCFGIFRCQMFQKGIMYPALTLIKRNLEQVDPLR